LNCKEEESIQSSAKEGQVFDASDLTKAETLRATMIEASEVQQIAPLETG
jgi:hypothetical protein